MTGMSKDAAVVTYISGAAATWSLTDINEVLMAVGLALGAVLAVMRIVRGIKRWKEEGQERTGTNN